MKQSLGNGTKISTDKHELAKDRCHVSGLDTWKTEEKRETEDKFYKAY